MQPSSVQLSQVFPCLRNSSAGRAAHSEQRSLYSHLLHQLMPTFIFMLGLLGETIPSIFLMLRMIFFIIIDLSFQYFSDKILSLVGLP